jgi:hypothetical protein
MLFMTNEDLRNEAIHKAMEHSQKADARVRHIREEVREELPRRHGSRVWRKMGLGDQEAAVYATARDWMLKDIAWKGHIDDYKRYVAEAQMYGIAAINDTLKSVLDA